jgi:hypothetical protein
MDEKLNNNKKIFCSNHTSNIYDFFCYDDQLYLCDKCFKDHKKHNIEIKTDINDTNSIYKIIKKTNYNILLEQYKNFKQKLIEIKNKLESEIDKIQNFIDKFSNSEYENYHNNLKNKTIFEIDYNNFVFFTEIYNNYENIFSLGNNLNKLYNQMKLIKYKNLHWINKEVNIIESSPCHEGFDPDILLEKKNGDYYLSEGVKNNYIIFDLNKKYYLKDIKISVHDYECSLKNFSISYLDENKKWVLVKKYLKNHYNKNEVYQNFEINVECQKIKLDLIDNWGKGGGNYILVKRIWFNVGELE